ncbi:MAG: MFS transporter [Tannerellaceae bacterium]|nr:MFS transporter [Tannerellaceae bacterium]
MEKQQTTVPVRLVTASYVWSFLSSFLLFFAFYLLLPILPMYLIEQFQAGKSLIGIILSSYTITALLIRPFAGYLVDTFPRKIFLIVTYTLFTAFFAGYMIAATVFVFAMLRAMHGLAFGLVTISNSTVAIDIMPSQRRNEGIGYYALSTNIAMAVGPVVSLYLLDLFKGYDYIFLTSLISGMIGLFCVLMIKAPVHKKVKQEVISFDRFFLVKGLPCAIVFTLLAFSYGSVTS